MDKDKQKKLENSLNKNQNVLIACRPNMYDDVLKDLLRISSKNFRKVCFVSAHLSSSSLSSKIKGEKIDCSKFCFASSQDLAGLEKDLKKKIKNVDIIIVDNLSAMFKKNPEIAVLKFINNLAKNVQDSGSKSAYILLSTAKAKFIEDISLSMDEVIVA